MRRLLNERQKLGEQRFRTEYASMQRGLESIIRNVVADAAISGLVGTEPNYKSNIDFALSVMAQPVANAVHQHELAIRTASQRLIVGNAMCEAVEDLVDSSQEPRRFDDFLNVGHAKSDIPGFEALELRNDTGKMVKGAVVLFRVDNEYRISSEKLTMDAVAGGVLALLGMNLNDLVTLGAAYSGRDQAMVEYLNMCHARPYYIQNWEPGDTLLIGDFLTNFSVLNSGTVLEIDVYLGRKVVVSKEILIHDVRSEVVERMERERQQELRRRQQEMIAARKRELRMRRSQRLRAQRIANQEAAQARLRGLAGQAAAQARSIHSTSTNRTRRAAHSTRKRN